MYDISDDTEELQRQYEILANLEEMKRKQRSNYVAKQVCSLPQHKNMTNQTKQTQKKKHFRYSFFVCREMLWMI